VPCRRLYDPQTKQNSGQSLDCQNMAHETTLCPGPDLSQNCHSATESCYFFEIPTTNVPWHTGKFKSVKYYYHKAYIKTNPEKLAVSQLVKNLRSVFWAFCAYTSHHLFLSQATRLPSSKFPFIFFKLSFKSLFHLRLGLPRSPFTSGCCTKTMYVFHPIEKMPSSLKYCFLKILPEV
jgi:hypothetical protein